MTNKDQQSSESAPVLQTALDQAARAYRLSTERYAEELYAHYGHNAWIRLDSDRMDCSLHVKRRDVCTLRKCP